jgi:integrase
LCGTVFHRCSTTGLQSSACGGTISVHRYETADGSRWQVRWRDANGRVRTKSLTSKSEATALDADVKARKFKGDALPRYGKESLAGAYDEWLRLRGNTLAPHTQRVYKQVWNKHIKEPGFDGHRLTDLVADPMLLEELTADMRERGVGPAAQRKTLVVLSAVLTAAVHWKKIPTNPVWRMPKPPGTPQRVARPFPPLVVERIRLRMARRKTRPADDVRPHGDACLVSLLSYAGLRPGEALALRWGDVGKHALAVDKAVADGKIGTTKTGVARSVPVSQTLYSDLTGWHLLSGGPADDKLVFPSADGEPWSRSQANNWRARVWRPVLESLATERRLAHLATAIPYDCRGSFVSLHLRAGASPLEVAAWAGHSPQVMFQHYAAVIEELVDEPRIPVEEQIQRARDVVEDKPSDELDDLAAQLFAKPTIASAGKSGAAKLLYEPEGRPE